MPGGPWKPTRLQIEAAGKRRVPDVIGPDLRVLFVGINPGLYTAAVGHHFARPGNRFWPALHASGFTERLLSPFEEHELLCRRIGITNLVPRATLTAAEVTREELLAGARRLRAKVCRYRPAFVAVLGITAWREAVCDPAAVLGEQPGDLEGARVWVLPNPSGLNAHYRPADLARLFAELRVAADLLPGTSGPPPGC